VSFDATKLPFADGRLGSTCQDDCPKAAAYDLSYANQLKGLDDVRDFLTPYLR
jgi:hypothetical protein